MENQDKQNDIQITHPAIEQYAHNMTSDESDAVTTLIQQSDEELEFIDMLSGKLVGQLLKLLIQISGAKKVLEIGTFTGYSALMMAEALPAGGEILTMEMNERYQEMAESHFKQFDTGKKIKLLKGDAHELILDLSGAFDLVFLDADKISYPFYYEHIMERLNPGGLLVADNVLWSGKVMNPDDPKSKAMDAFNKQVKQDERVEQVLLPVRDGISVIRKIN